MKRGPFNKSFCYVSQLEKNFFRNRRQKLFIIYFLDSSIVFRAQNRRKFAFYLIYNFLERKLLNSISISSLIYILFFLYKPFFNRNKSIQKIFCFYLERKLFFRKNLYKLVEESNVSILRTDRTQSEECFASETVFLWKKTNKNFVFIPLLLLFLLILPLLLFHQNTNFLVSKRWQSINSSFSFTEMFQGLEWLLTPYPSFVFTLLLSGDTTNLFLKIFHNIFALNKFFVQKNRCFSDTNCTSHIQTTKCYF